MFVRMLTAMAGDDHSYAYGETVPVTDEIGAAWIAAGIAEPALDAEAAKRAAAEATARVAELEGLLAEAEADRDAVKGQAEALGLQVADLTAQLAAAATAAASAKGGKAKA